MRACLTGNDAHAADATALAPAPSDRLGLRRAASFCGFPSQAFGNVSDDECIEADALDFGALS